VQVFHYQYKFQFFTFPVSAKTPKNKASPAFFLLNNKPRLQTSKNDKRVGDCEIFAQLTRQNADL
jgi:hypothetical protein